MNSVAEPFLLRGAFSDVSSKRTESTAALLGHPPSEGMTPSVLLLFSTNLGCSGPQFVFSGIKLGSSRLFGTSRKTHYLTKALK